MKRTHIHCTHKIGQSHPLYGKTVYVPAMDDVAATLLTAAFRWLGIDSKVMEPSDARTLALASQVLGGDECYPAKITMGDVLKVAEQPGLDPEKTVILMASSDGPCRLGQYPIYIKKVLKDRGLGAIQLLSPSDNDGYAGFGDISGAFVRTAWRIIVASDIIRKLLLKTRPYEVEHGAADDAFWRSVDRLSNAIEFSCSRPACQLRQIREALDDCRSYFQSVQVHGHRERPKVAVIGELFCRLNTFSNDDMVRKLEDAGAEVLLSGMAEWIHYINFDSDYRLKLHGRGFTLEMLGAKVRQYFQRADEIFLMKPFVEELKDEPHFSLQDILRHGEKYLPFYAIGGEMVVSAGVTVCHAQNGIDGIVDIAPFTCMNGIVSEAIYPKISRDCGGIPIRSFYFDGTQKSLASELGIYMELVNSYRERRLTERSQEGAGVEQPSYEGGDTPSDFAEELI